MAEVRARGPNEQSWVAIEDADYAWENFLPQPGDVVEFEASLVPQHLGSLSIAAFLVLAVEEAADGSLVLQGRCVGSDNDDVGKTLSSMINRRLGALHLCRDSPCSFAEDPKLVHAVKARWHHRETFEADYMKPWGRMVLKEYGSEEDPPSGPRRGALKKPAAKEKSRASKPGAGAAAPHAEAADGLRARLSKLRSAMAGGGRKTAGRPIEVLASGESSGGEEEDSTSLEEAEEPDTSGGPKKPRTTLALADSVKGEEEAMDSGPRGRSTKKKKKVRARRSKDPGLQLLAQAAQVREVRKEEAERKERKKTKSSSTGRVKALVKALTGEKKRSKDRGREAALKKKRKRRAEGGDDGDSSGESSGSSGGGEEESDSSSSELLAPLQKKSVRKPGAVLKLLIQHAKHTMDQSAIVESQQDETVTGGIKMTSYFNLLVRPYHPASSRDMKERNHLSIGLDELRAGELGKLGDSLASRFLALHTAVNEGNWRAAQFLELHPLEPTQGAPAALLLEARRHGKMVQKAQGSDDWKRGRGDQEPWPAGNKGKGNKGKGKGKTKDWPRGGKGDQNWQGGGAWGKPQKNNWWASQQEKADNKEAKPAEKDAKK